MRKVLYLVGMSLLGVSLSQLALAETARSIKIGVLNDASGPYSDNAGEGSVTAAKMAAEDFMQKHPGFKNDAPAVIRKMKETPIDDDLFGPVVVRSDGRAIHNMYILKAKSPAASRSKWDLLEQVGVLSGPEAFRPADDGGCSLVEQAKNN